MTELKKSLDPSDIESHHFITHQDQHGRKLAPKSMRITFKNKEIAKKFIQTDSHFSLGYIMKNQKTWHTDINIIQCKVCRKVGHRRGNPRCDGKPRCPRCLSESHYQPTEDCTPVCHEHGSGHSTGSDKCPTNIKYRKQQRAILLNNQKISNQTETTAPDIRQFHQDVLKLQENLKNNSYSAAVKSQSRNNTPIPNTNPIQTSNFNTSAFASAYVAACISEAYDPGSFQEVLDEYAESNNFPKIKHPAPRPAVLRALAPEAPAVVETAAGDDSNTISPSDIVDLPSLESTPSLEDQAQAASVIPKRSEPSAHFLAKYSTSNSPTNTRNVFEQKMNKIVEKTTRAPVLISIIATGNIQQDIKFEQSLVKTTKLSIGELNHYVNDNLIYMTHKVEKSCQLTREIMQEAASISKFENRYIGVKLVK